MESHPKPVFPGTNLVNLRPMRTGFFLSILALFFGLVAHAGASMSVAQLQAILQAKLQEATQKHEEVTREKIAEKNAQYLKKMDAQQQSICIEDLYGQERKLGEEKIQLFQDQIAMLTEAGIKKVLNGQSPSKEAGGLQVQAALKARLEKTKASLASGVNAVFEKTKCDILTGLTGALAKRGLHRKLGEKFEELLKAQSQAALVLD